MPEDDDCEFITKKDKNGEIIKFDAETGRRVPKRTAKTKKPDPHEVRKFFKPHTGEASSIIHGIMMDDSNSPNQRLQAARMILEYGWGRPSKMRRYDDDGETNSLEDVSFRELNMLLLQLTQGEDEDEEEEEEDYIDV